VTALDVLSGGRAYLGIGATWYEREHRGLGIPFPELSERFERLEETLQIAHQMWSPNNGPYQGKYYRLAETINSPQPVQKPHPPILLGGGGEKKTLRLVARYADACNFIAEPAEVGRKLEVLRAHCAAEGRNYEEIQKTILLPWIVLGPGGSSPDQIVDQLGAYADVGVTMAIMAFADVGALTPIEVIGRDVIPQAARL
jgi:alkanesulfonate monooxygenase SsuD/methylene tetrahydromethanopterin reductase-like flavin-dependent oxidoreductase (luciferase family)